MCVRRRACRWCRSGRRSTSSADAATSRKPRSTGEERQLGAQPRSHVSGSDRVAVAAIVGDRPRPRCERPRRRSQRRRKGKRQPQSGVRATTTTTTMTMPRGVAVTNAGGPRGWCCRRQRWRRARVSQPTAAALLLKSDGYPHGLGLCRHRARVVADADADADDAEVAPVSAAGGVPAAAAPAAGPATHRPKSSTLQAPGWMQLGGASSSFFPFFLCHGPFLWFLLDRRRTLLASEASEASEASQPVELHGT